jgi:hypothetical protein
MKLPLIPNKPSHRCLAISLALSLSSLASPPVQAAGFLDLNNGWTGAAVCGPGQFGCVENLTSTTVSLIGLEQATSQLAYVSQAVPSGNPGYQSISFNYSFAAQPFQDAFYTFAGNLIVLPSTGGSLSQVIIPGVLGPGQTIAFGVANGPTSDFAQLDITNFSYSNFSNAAVPAPLPLLGAGAAFASIRRRRAILQARIAAKQSLKL